MVTARMDGSDLYFDEVGSGPPLLLIPGNGGGSVVWGATVEALARDCRVIAALPARPGRGPR